MMAEAQECNPSDEEMRKLLKPNPIIDQVLAAVQKSFVREGQSVKIVQMLESYDDRNYWVDISGTSYLVKVHNGVESLNFIKLWKEESAHERSVIHLQNTIMEHLAFHGIKTNNPVPPIVAHEDDTSPPTAASIHSLPVVSEKHSPCQLVVRLLTWVPGRPMSSFPMLPLESIVNVGRFLGHFSAKLHLLNADQLKASHRFHQWDGKNTVQLTEWVPYIQDEWKRAMIVSIIDAFQKDLLDSGDGKLFSSGLIHGDFNDANILFDDNFAVSGVLDFGDSVYSWSILDLTVAMAYAMLTVYGKRNRMISAGAALLRGYNAVKPLTDLERRHLVLLVSCRLACSATLGAYSIQQNPENEYLLLHSKPAWDCLELIWGRDATKRQEMAKALNQVFDLACSVSHKEGDADVLECTDLAFPDPVIVDPLSSSRASDSSNGNDRAAKRKK